MKVIDLMSGIGGRAIAFKNVGFDVVCAIDNDRESAEIYCKLIAPDKFIFQDIISISPKALPEADIISGKLLYKSFSAAGKHRSELDEKVNATIFSIINYKKPMFFVLEAPVRILSQNNREIVENMLEKYISYGYNVMYNVFTESEYSGYPVTGKQLFFIGIRKDLFVKEFYFPKPIFLECKNEWLKEDENVVNEWYRKVPKVEVENIIEGKCYLRQGRNLRERGILKETKQIHVGFYREMYVVDAVGIRRFTHNELALLKGIKNYNFNNCVNKQKMYMRIAYASNVYVVEAISKALKDYVDDQKFTENNTLGLEKKKKKVKVQKCEQKRIVFPKHRITNIHIDELKGMKNLDISINRNLTAIMGVNGSGKSTILHALACVYSPYGKGDNYKFSFFFTPNPDSDWRNSRFSLTYYDENQQKEITRVYKKDSDRWSPRYAKRPIRDTYFVGIETCIPEIEKEKQTSYIDYSTDSMEGEVNQKIIRGAAYILNKDYENLTVHKTKKKELFGVHTAKKLTYSSLSMGAGEQRILKILKLIYSVNSYSLILIDEIDLLLHVTALRRLIIVLSEVAIKRNLQIIFTTHSLEMVNLGAYVDIRYLEQVGQKTMVYNSVNADMVYEMSNCMDKPIEIYVEDLLAQVIVRKIAEDLNLLGYLKIVKYGASSNAFILAVSYILKKEEYSNVAIILDGDVYMEQEKKIEAIKKVLSGTESEHEQKIKNALSMIRQFNLPLNVAPEKHIFNMLVEMDDDNEVVKYAKKVKAVSDSHQWLDELTARMGQGEELILFRIVDIVSQNSKWGDYVKNVREWLLEKKKELNLWEKEC